ncbi:histidine kinase [Lacinutrix sp. C3R15]|uniref:sensor histidine kinase n=1 Tax=Flavobacteriaceae TaxID=49546 RepID=UPI001C09566C|nr:MULTISPECIES: histidine kinase [Flavobacteriaceae]MBU2940795.1 histidine kinase [Lacinutrix sp. C3R15]MDO6624113.1 histidine kinase [Oceanihabitans sp. 1_MG-2023]
MNKKILNKKASRFFETTFIFLFWILLFILPLFYQWINSHAIRWNVLFNVWIDYLPLLTIFCVNRFVLTPLLLFKNKKFLYLLSVIIVIGLTVIGSISFREELPSQSINPQQKRVGLQFPNSTKTVHPQRGFEPRADDGTYPPYVNLILLSILLVGFDTGMKTSVKWAEIQQQKAEVEKENIKNELAFLRNQVSPHFLMNTLNNIHALVDFDTKEAKRSIGKLSVLMRHLLYESSDKPIPLTKEIKFIESYVELMKLRFHEDVKIQLNLPENPPKISIPTLLFTNILENAFKYGISYEQNSFVDINLSIHENELQFTIQNSVHEKLKSVEKSGIGIKNTEKRLRLLYNDAYVFTYTEHENIYIATIKIPI